MLPRVCLSSQAFEIKRDEEKNFPGMQTFPNDPRAKVMKNNESQKMSGTEFSNFKLARFPGLNDRKCNGDAMTKKFCDPIITSTFLRIF